MQLGSALSWFQRKAASPREDGDEEAAIDNPFPHGGSRLERRRSNQVNKLTASDLHGKSKQDLVTYCKNKYDFNGDGIFQDDEVEQMLLDTIEICESRAGLEVEKDMMLNKLRKMNRRMKIMGATGVVAIIASVLGTYFGSESTVTQGTVEVKDSIIKSKTTSVGMDNNGHSHLQDAKSGLDISTRGFGDTFHTEAKVDPSSRRKLICMTIEEIAALFQDTMSRTEASVVIVGEDGYEKQIVPIDGQFVDNGRTLHFGRGEDSVTMIMDSDVCNTAIPPADFDDIQVTFEEEVEEVPYQLDIDAAVEDASSGAVEVKEAVPADDGIFNRARNLISRFVGVPSQVVDDPQANPDARVKVVDMSTSHGSTDKDPSRHLFSSSSSEVLARHRAEFEIAKRSPRGERKMQAGGSVEICSGDGCESTSCTISGVDSDGSAGNLILDENGNLSLNGNTNDPRFFDPTTLGTSRDATTTFENINNFIIAPGQTVNVIGTLIVKGIHMQIDGELNGNGGGYVGGARRTSLAESDQEKNGSGPPDTNGQGQGGWSYSGGAGAGHGGNGGEGGWQNGYSGRAYGGSSYDTTLPSVDLQPGSGGGGGSGDSAASGGRGGHGGAAIRLFAVDTIKIDGSILSNGENGEGCTSDDSTCGYSGGGGGSGGSISLSSCTIDAGSSSLVQANGGAGGRSRYTSNVNCGGGGGGGGVIQTETLNTIGTLVLQVDGGARPSGGRKPGDAGNVGKVFLIDNLEVGESCDVIPSYVDSSTPLDKNARCASGICRTSDNKCGCTMNDDCLSSSEVCHTDNKCYSSGLSIGQSCTADNGDNVDARCTSGKCRSTDNKCGCTINGHCSTNLVCKTSTNTCETQQYRLFFNCDLGVSGEGTGSRVSLEVKKGSNVIYSTDEMDTQSLGEGESGRCPIEAFVVDEEPDKYEIRIHGSDALGVDYFTLYDATNGGKKSWGAEGDGGWCFSTDGREGCWSVSGANFPNLGVILKEDGSSERIRFGSGTRCKKNGACINSCKVGGGSCKSNKCCT